jgi:hypothetical protein
VLAEIHIDRTCRYHKKFKCFTNVGCGSGEISCYDTQCDYDNPTGLHPCNLQPCPTYSWQIRRWSACDKTCGSGVQTRLVACIDSDGSAADNANCGGTQLATSQACNVDPCIEEPLLVNVPNSMTTVAAGDNVDVSWSGGTRYGQVSITVALLVSPDGVDGAQFSSAAAGLPEVVENTGSLQWTLPGTMSSGFYVMRIMSKGTGTSADSQTFRVRGPASYAVSVETGRASEATSATLNLILFGSTGLTASAEVSGEFSSSDSTTKVIEIQDIGVVIGLDISIADGQTWNADVYDKGSVVQVSGVRVSKGNPDTPFEAVFGIGSKLTPGHVVSRDDCASQQTCHDCALSDGCGWCDGSDSCVPGNFYGPFQAGTTCSSWQTRLNQCPDTCAVASTCQACSQLLSCGWCQSSASCIGASSTGPLFGQCDAADWAVGSCDQFGIDCSSPAPIGECSDIQINSCDRDCLARVINAQSQKEDCPGVPAMPARCEVNCVSKYSTTVPSCLDAEISARNNKGPGHRRRLIDCSNPESNVQLIQTICCSDDANPCVDGVPTNKCEKPCADVYLPFYEQCAIAGSNR